jgi:hypothetical protein
MGIRRWIVATASAAAAGWVLAIAPVMAHHSSTPFYDADTVADIEGTVTRFVFKNPHAFLFLDVTDANGQTVEWQVELGAPVSLRRTGWTPETLPVGMVVKVSGPQARGEGSKGVLGRRLTRADGSPVVAGGRVSEEQQAPR